jgi:hypothetical protein
MAWDAWLVARTDMAVVCAARLSMVASGNKFKDLNGRFSSLSTGIKQPNKFEELNR